MDLQKILKESSIAMRQKSLKDSDQLTLGELILKIEPLIVKQEDIKKRFDEEARVIYDFGGLFPTCLDSWRGSYSELALDFKDYGYKEHQAKPMSVTSFLKMLKEALGKTFVGYKGGDFVMNKHTPIWVSNYGESSHTVVIEVVDNDYDIILITALREF